METLPSSRGQSSRDHEPCKELETSGLYLIMFRIQKKRKITSTKDDDASRSKQLQQSSEVDSAPITQSYSANKKLCNSFVNPQDSESETVNSCNIVNEVTSESRASISTAILDDGENSYENDIGRWVGRSFVLTTEKRMEMLKRCWVPPEIYDFAGDATHLKRKFNHSCILADGLADTSGKEQLVIGLRYYDQKEKNIKEEFTGFVELEKMDVQTIAAESNRFINTLNIDAKKCVRQGYDGCATMAPYPVLCNKVLSNDSMKPSKLKDHLRCHPDKIGKDLKYFQMLKEKYEKRSTVHSMFSSTSESNDDGLRASYNISLLIAKSGKPHTIGEQLILPAALEVECLDGDIQTYVQHLIALHDDFKFGFEDILSMETSPRIINPFDETEVENVILQEELLELSTNEELKVTFKRGYQKFWLQPEISEKHPGLESVLRQKYTPKIPLLCETRWSYKYQSISMFKKHFVEIAEGLEKLSREDKYNSMLQPVANKLQSKTLDVLRFAEHIQTITTAVAERRRSAEKGSEDLIKSAEEIATIVAHAASLATLPAPTNESHPAPPGCLRLIIILKFQIKSLSPYADNEIIRSKLRALTFSLQGTGYRHTLPAVKARPLHTARPPQSMPPADTAGLACRCSNNKFEHLQTGGTLIYTSERSISSHAMVFFFMNILVDLLKANGLSESFTEFCKHVGVSPKTPATPAISSTIETDTSQKLHIVDDVEMSTMSKNIKTQIAMEAERHSKSDADEFIIVGKNEKKTGVAFPYRTTPAKPTRITAEASAPYFISSAPQMQVDSAQQKTKLPFPIVLQKKYKRTLVRAASDAKYIKFRKATNAKNGISINPSTPSDHRKLTSLLSAMRIYHTHTLDGERELRVVIRGITHKLAINNTKTDLAKYPSLGSIPYGRKLLFRMRRHVLQLLALWPRSQKLHRPFALFKVLRQLRYYAVLASEEHNGPTRMLLLRQTRTPRQLPRIPQGPKTQTKLINTPKPIQN
ncbi:Protein ZBED8 [Eumeta japonica]|uniref:Protein ZBED8 n=1 Tax=Eumeta variegata TaxID=151549 RepID=A0A4C1SZX7_EUMVA|nr:Protein ZBED8 [Eumeta japonica]